VNFEYSPKVQELRQKLAAFMAEHVYPNEKAWKSHVTSAQRWQPVPLIEQLKEKRARRACGTCGGRRPTAARSPTSSTRRCARSWGA
jgi:hypothetical protein